MNAQLILSSSSMLNFKKATFLHMPGEWEKEHHQKMLIMSIDDKARNNAIHEMHEFQYQMAYSNRKNPMFWYLPVSEFQPFMSCIFKAFEVKAFLESTLYQTKDTFIYHDNNSFLLNFLRKSLKHNYLLTFCLKEKLKFNFKYLKLKVLRYINLICWFYQTLKILITSKKIQNFPKELDILFISRFEKNCEDSSIGEKSWDDTYLGELPSLMKDHKIAILGRCGGNPTKISRVLESFKDFPLVSMHQVLSVGSLIKIFFKTLAFKLNIDRVQDVCMARLAYLESRNHCWAIADCLVVEEALKNFLINSSVKKIVIMQENAAWENAVVVARNKISSKIPVVGYFHCPIMPSSFRYHIRKDTRALKLHPDRIITLGRGMSAALRELGDWGDLLIDGYAFRTPDLKSIKVKAKETKPPFKVLVLLGGNFCHVTFLKWIHNSIQSLNISGYTFLVKSHPRLDPASVYLQRGNIKFGEHSLFFPLEQEITLAQALAMCNGVLFKGTTAGFSALAAGLPIAHFCHGGLLSDNVFFNTEGICNTIRTENDLSKFLGSLGAGLKDSTLSRMKEYVLLYYEGSKKYKNKTIKYINDF